ncbi:MAG: hypothetical protein LBU32_17655 [Clostridiales bacterium]|nr:hypothetical protein [Clostridiales bacterium]
MKKSILLIAILIFALFAILLFALLYFALSDEKEIVVKVVAEVQEVKERSDSNPAVNPDEVASDASTAEAGADPADGNGFREEEAPQAPEAPQVAESPEALPPKPLETPEPQEISENYELEVIKASDSLSLELSQVPDLGSSGIVKGTLRCADPEKYRIITVIETEEGLSFTKPSLRNPFTEIKSSGEFEATFYTDTQEDLYVPKISLYFASLDFVPAFEIEDGQEWAVSRDSLRELELGSDMAVRIKRR